MANANHKVELLARRKRRIRKRITGTPDQPRLRVHRTLKHIYAQIIDDVGGRTLATASSVGLKISGANVEAAKSVGKALAEKAQEQNIGTVCFDRGGCLFHGRVKALADAARESGLKF